MKTLGFPRPLSGDFLFFTPTILGRKGTIQKVGGTLKSGSPAKPYGEENFMHNFFDSLHRIS